MAMNGFTQCCLRRFSTVIKSVFNYGKNQYLKDRATPSSFLLQNLLPDDKVRLENIKMEWKVLQSSGHFSEKFELNDNDYLELLTSSSEIDRTRYYTFLSKSVSISVCESDKNVFAGDVSLSLRPVSYTHLTLPTIYSV